MRTGNKDERKKEKPDKNMNKLEPAEDDRKQGSTMLNDQQVPDPPKGRCPVRGTGQLMALIRLLQPLGVQFGTISVSNIQAVPGKLARAQLVHPFSWN